MSEDSFFTGVEVGDSRVTEARTITEADVTYYPPVTVTPSPHGKPR